MAASHTTDPRVIRVGMLGCGVVGQGLLKLLDKHRPDFVRNGFDLRLTHVAVRDAAKARPGLPAGIRVGTDPLAVAGARDVDVLVELMGGTTLAVEAACQALARGVPVVTANKAALARHLPRYLEAARSGKAAVAFEAAVAAHIPIMEVLERSLACEEISVIKGVVNGTTNYILTFMERAGCEYADALADAAAKGFTEADPRLDVDGIDAAEKLSLLALKAFGAYFPPEAIHTEGITRVAQADLRLAQAMDHRIKLIAAARQTQQGLSLRVHPALVHKGELLADVDSEFNAIIIEGPAFKELTFLGKGAGQLPTASAVLNDLVKLAREPGHSALPVFARESATGLRLADKDNVSLCYFLRLPVKPADAWRAIERIGKLGLRVLSNAQVETGGTNWLGVIVDVVDEPRLLALLPQIAAIPGVQGSPVFIRLDKDNYRDIVDREQSAYFGASLERKPGAGI